MGLRERTSQISVRSGVKKRRFLSARKKITVPAQAKTKATRSQVRPDKFAQYSTSQLLRLTLRAAKATAVSYWRTHRVSSRIIALLLVLLILFAIIYPTFREQADQKKYDIQAAEFLLDRPVSMFADKLQRNSSGDYVYNEGYAASVSETAGQVSGPRFTAEFDSNDASVTVNDSSLSVTMSHKPQFSVDSAIKNENRVVYGINGVQGALVYTAQAASVKEDIVLYEYQRDVMRFEFELGLNEAMEARLEPNGSVAVYGANSPILGNVATGTEQDAELLKKARENSEKTKLLFTIPAPFIVEAAGVSKSAKARFHLEGSRLTLEAYDLKNASYPLSIDPTIYIETAKKLMRGNNETNTDFDSANELIQKSQTTGARIDEWSDTLSYSTSYWDHSVAAAGGYVYSAGGVAANVTTTTYTSQGASTFVVPAGVSFITVKMWGGGGGGGGGGSTGPGGAGGAGGYVTSTLSVTPAETLNTYVGGGGGAGSGNATSGGGGGGGGHSEIDRSGTRLLIAPGGGGGGGGDNSAATAGGAGGAGGTTTGVGGSASGTANGGGAGTQAAGGAAGTGGSNTGSAGGLESAGDGADGRSGAGADGGQNNGGQADDGDGGTGNVNNGFAGGGGGGGGYYGGGGGSGSVSGNAGGGGGGSGSCYTSGTAPECIAGSGTTPGNSGDGDRAGAADGGAGGGTTASGTAGDNGIIVITYSSTPANSTALNWAQFNTSTNVVEASNPGAGACASWCTDTDYNLSEARIGASMVAYNGFLYLMGGSDGTNRESTVWIAKLGANGEPQLWHPTDTNPNNWVYWYVDSGLNGATARSYFSAVAYNNRMYVLGGQTNASTGGVTTVEMADILPNGRLGTWTTTGMQALPSARHMHTAHVYNDVMYLIGGNSSGTLQSSVHYSKINSDGTMNPWTATTSFTTARATFGGSYSTIWGAYIYLGGGCTALTSGYCSTVASDTQIGSINADGTISQWTTISGLTNQLIGYTFYGWQGGLYRFGGCQAQNTSTGACNVPTASVDYGTVNPAGEVSTINISSPSGTAPCNGGSPNSCDLPTVGDDAGEVGHMLNMSVILNGFLYVIGGCAEYVCNDGTNSPTNDNISSNTAYVTIASDGTLSAPSSCGGTSYGAWCVDSTNTINGADGVAAAGVTTFNGRIYVIGGIDSTGAVTGEMYYNTPNTSTGAISAWTAQTLSNIGVTENIFYTYTFTRANPASASTYPGNLYILGGCGTGGSGPGCGSNDYETEVYKCNIEPAGNLEEDNANDCDVGGQLQLDVELADETNQGLGIHSGTVYANYIYLIGGFSANVADRDTVFYAKIDNNNNIVSVTTSAAGGDADDWIESPNTLSIGRRRGWAFGYNGHIYSLGGYDDSGTGIIPFIEWAKMDVSDGSIDPFTTSSVTINQRWGLSVAVSNSYAYVIGGCDAGASPSNCTSFEEKIQTFQLYNNNSGAVNDYTAQSDDTFTAEEDRWGASAAVYNGYLYVAGGCVSATDCTDATNSVQYAPISATDGTVGTWAAGGNLPADRAWGSLEVAGGTLYYIGGQDDTATNEQSTVYYTTGISVGNPTWSGSAATNGLPAARTKFGSAVWDNRIYVMGGLDGSAASSAVVYVSPKLSSGGNITTAWSTSTSFNVARNGTAATAYANNLYIFGGFDGTNYLNDVQFASIGYKTGTISQSGTTVTGSGTTFTSSMVGSDIQYADGSTATITAFGSSTSLTVDESKTVAAGTNYIVQDGSVGSWTYTNSLPQAIRDARAVSANGYMYLIGGRTASTTCPPNTIIAPISANTTITTKNNPTGIGEWYETNVRYTGDRYGAAVAYDDGKLYTMGGGCSAPIDCASAQCHYYSTVRSQPQVAIYSRMIDTDSDVFPTSWLMNGIDNAIGARWQVKYRSMHDLDTLVNPSEDCGTSSSMAQMTTWGQETNHGTAYMGDVSAYTPLNSSGGNINCARYYYFHVSIDASRTFGYPEDVNRGPTISDLSLFFTSDPNKRLRHGKTFTGGEQQPLDTPCRQSVDAQCPLP